MSAWMDFETLGKDTFAVFLGEVKNFGQQMSCNARIDVTYTDAAGVNTHHFQGSPDGVRALRNGVPVHCILPRKSSVIYSIAQVPAAPIKVNVATIAWPDTGVGLGDADVDPQAPQIVSSAVSNSRVQGTLQASATGTLSAASVYAYPKVGGFLVDRLQATLMALPLNAGNSWLFQTTAVFPATTPFGEYLLSTTYTAQP